MTDRHEPTAEDYLGYYADTMRIIEEHGVAIQYVFGTPDNPTLPFAYTVGLNHEGHPELLTLGLPQEIAHYILNRLAAHVQKQGDTYTDGDLVTDVLEGGVPLRIRGPVEDQQYPANTARAIYGDDIRVLQVEWPDVNGRFADDPAHDPKRTSPQIPMKEA